MERSTRKAPCSFFRAFVLLSSLLFFFSISATNLFSNWSWCPPQAALVDCAPCVEERVLPVLSSSTPPPQSATSTPLAPCSRDAWVQLAAHKLNAGFFPQQDTHNKGGEPFTAWHSFALEPYEESFDDPWMPLVPSGRQPIAVVPPGRKVNILLIGDSTDQNTCRKACELWNGTMVDQTLIGKVWVKWSNLGCNLSWGSLSTAHTYGAQQRGPYQRNISVATMGNDPGIDTVVRIPLIFQSYRSEWGFDPDVVIYQSVLWTVKVRGARIMFVGVASA